MAYVPRTGNIKVVGQEHLLAAANCMHTHETEVWLLRPESSLLQWPSQVSIDVTQTLQPALLKQSPILSAGTCKWTLSCPVLQMWQDRLPQLDTKFEGSN